MQIGNHHRLQALHSIEVMTESLTAILSAWARHPEDDFLKQTAETMKLALSKARDDFASRDEKGWPEVSPGIESFFRSEHGS